MNGIHDQVLFEVQVTKSKSLKSLLKMVKRLYSLQSTCLLKESEVSTFRFLSYERNEMYPLCSPCESICLLKETKISTFKFLNSESSSEMYSLCSHCESYFSL